MSEQPSAGWCNRCGGVLTSFERGRELCANCEGETDSSPSKEMLSTQIALRLHEMGLLLENTGHDEIVMALGVAEREIERLLQDDARYESARVVLTGEIEQRDKRIAALLEDQRIGCLTILDMRAKLDRRDKQLSARLQEIDDLKQLAVRQGNTIRRLSGEREPPHCASCSCGQEHDNLGATTHWSKDPLIPYAGCDCSSCSEARAVVVGVSDGTAHSDQLRTVWTKSTDSDPYCVHCGTT